MNSGYYPAVVNKIPRIQTISSTMQAPFYFGGSQVPINLNMSGTGMIKEEQPKYKNQPYYKTTPHKPKIPFINK